MSNTWKSSWMLWLYLVFWLWASLKHGQKYFLLPRKFFAMKQNHYFILLESMDATASVESCLRFNCVQWKQIADAEWPYFWYSTITRCWKVFSFACLLHYEYYVSSEVLEYSIRLTLWFYCPIAFLVSSSAWNKLSYAL